MPTENPATEAGVFSRERRALTLGVLLAVTAFAVEGMGVVPALPSAVRALGGLPLFGWAFGAFMLASLVGTIAGGQIADARGPHRPMALGLSAFGAGLLLAALAGGMAQFLAGRALQGLGGGGMMAAAYVAVARGYPDALRARMMAIIASVWILPAIVGPALSGAVAERAGWRAVFAGVVPLLALTAGLVLPPLRPLSVRRPPAGASRVPAALRLALGTSLVLAAPSLHESGLGAALASAAAGGALLWPALRTLLPPGTLLGRRGLPAGLLARGLLAFAFFGTEAFVPLGAGELRGATPFQAGLALTAGSLGWIAASWAQDRMEARRGADPRARSVGAGFLLLAMGIAVVAAALVTRLPLPLVSLGWAVGGAGIGFAYSAGTLLCFAAAPAGGEGEVSGQLQVTEALGTAAGTGVGGTLLALLGQLGHTPREAHASVFALTAATALVGAALAGRISSTTPAAALPSPGPARSP
jgi:MFS family permease